MSNRKNQIEETNERINEFSFACMLNPHLNKNKAFKYQVKTCLSNTFGADTNKHILYISKYYHSSYSTDNFNNQKETMDRLFSTYVTPQIKEIYHPEIIQE